MPFRLFVLAAMMFAVLMPPKARAWGGHGGGGFGWGGHGGSWGHGRGWHGWGPRFGWRFGRFGTYRGAAIAGSPGYYESLTYGPGCVWVRQLAPGPYGPVWHYTPACYYGF